MDKEEFRQLRKSKGMNMSEAARRSGTPHSTWRDWESGQRRVPGIAVSWLQSLTPKRGRVAVTAAKVGETFPEPREVADGTVSICYDGFVVMVFVE